MRLGEGSTKMERGRGFIHVIKLWRVSDGSLVRTLTEHTDWVSSVAFSPDGQVLVSGSGDRTIKLWRVSDGSLVRTLTGYIFSGYSIAFSPDGQNLASGGSDGLALWRIGTK
jgi:WD40 repeat protein